jgi:hypothetical protein
MRRVLLLAGLLTSTLVLTACPGGGSGGDAGATPGSTRMCQGEERVMLDCSSEVNYQGVSGDAEISVMDIASAKGGFEEKAIRRVNEQVEQFVAAQTRACRDYNACVMSNEDYRVEATETRQRMQILPTLMTALKSAKTESERVKVLDRLYRGVVPDEKRVEEVTFQMNMLATLPAELGGGSFSVAPGGAVPTGAKVHFTVRTSKQAYLYIFQTTPLGEVNVLFPDARIGTSNPMTGGVAARIPGAQSFRVNDKDIGTEHVYVVVSAKPLNDIGSALGKVRSGKVKTMAQSSSLRSLAIEAAPETSNCRALELQGGEPCPNIGTQRALVLGGDDDDDDSGVNSRRLDVEEQAPPMQVRPTPGDDRIVTVYSFQHLTAAAYKAAGGSSAKAHRSRGAVIDN